jgi:hypothetical protein
MTRWNRPLLALSGIMTVLTVVAFVGLFVDDRIVTGAPVWLKVFKFAVSFAIYGVSIAWTLTVLPRRGRAMERAAVVIAAAAAIEVGIITFQAMRGRMSHFNQATLFDAVLWQTMGATVMVLWFAQLFITVAATRRPIPDRTAAQGIRLGLAVSLLGMLVAVPMTLPFQSVSDAITGAHSVGVADGGPGLPLIGWSVDGGDLRIGHFAGLHALQVLPLLAWALTRLDGLGVRLGETTRVRLLGVAGAAYAAFTLGLMWQALRGQPLLRPDAVTLAALGALVAGTVAAAVIVILKGRRAVPGAEAGAAVRVHSLS